MAQISLSMSSFERNQPTPFDNIPIEGLFFFDGNQLSVASLLDLGKGYKYAAIMFPSGLTCPILMNTDAGEVLVHLFGSVDLPLIATCDQAWSRIVAYPQENFYLLAKLSDDRLEIWGRTLDQHLILVFDNNTPRVVDLIRPENEPNTFQPPTHLTRTIY